MQNYNPTIGESLQYGNCNPGNGPLHTGGCVLPLEVTTVVWKRHPNSGLGSQRNIIVRGVPATVFNGGKSIEVYTGKLAIDVFADTPARALAAAQALARSTPPGTRRARFRDRLLPGFDGPAPYSRPSATREAGSTATTCSPCTDRGDRRVRRRRRRLRRALGPMFVRSSSTMSEDRTNIPLGPATRRNRIRTSAPLR